VRLKINTKSQRLSSPLVILNTRSFVRQRLIHPTWYFTQPTPAPHCLRKWCQNVSTYVRWSRDRIANGKRWSNQSLVARQCISSWRSAHRVLLVRKFRLRCVNCRYVMVQLSPPPTPCSFLCFTSAAFLIMLLIFLIFVFLVFYLPILSFSVHCPLAYPILFVVYLLRSNNC